MEWLKALLEALGVKLFRRRGGTPNRDFRVRTSLPAELTGEDGEACPAQVANLSSRGLKVTVPHLLHRGQEVLVRISGRTRPDRSILIRARTVWSRKHGRYYDAGLEFRGFQDTQYDQVVNFFRDEVQLEVQDTASRLRSPRRALRDYPLRYSPFGNLRSIKGVVQNISATGIRFHSDEAIELDTVLHLTIDLGQSRKSLTLLATVRRCMELKSAGWDVGATIRPVDEYNAEVLQEELARFATMAATV